MNEVIEQTETSNSDASPKRPMSPERRQTRVSDILAHVNDLSLKAKTEYYERIAHAKTLAFDDPNYRYNQLQQERAAGEWLALSRVEGFLEARIEIDSIWGLCADLARLSIQSKANE